MEAKIIKSEAEYRMYLREVQRLVGQDPDPDSEDGKRLELFALLVENYERECFPFEKPNPIEAIQFRMNEQGLRQVDLVPYLGTRSRVSEILSGKRPLTVQMIRELSKGLDIPADVLVGAHISQSTEAIGEDTLPEPEWDKFPAKEMQRHGYFDALRNDAGLTINELVREFYARVIAPSNSGRVFARQSLRGDAVTTKAKYGLLAWKARALSLAREKRVSRDLPRFEALRLDSAFLSQLANLSWHRDGVQLAIQLIDGIGIAVVVEPGLSGTQLDGAAMLDSDGSPVIGLTLRFDRVDNFWFTLFHELAHVMKHLSNPGDAFLDRIEDHESTDAAEIEANRIARDALIPRAAWRRSEVASAPSKERILKLATELKIHPAIIAGRVRRETGNYRVFGELLGNAEVRKHFPGLVFE